jgi:hypothetical protein
MDLFYPAAFGSVKENTGSRQNYISPVGIQTQLDNAFFKAHSPQFPILRLKPGTCKGVSLPPAGHPM